MILKLTIWIIYQSLSCKDCNDTLQIYNPAKGNFLNLRLASYKKGIKKGEAFRLSFSVNQTC